MLLVSNNLSNYGRRHFKQFTNCHVSRGTPCIFVLLKKRSYDKKDVKGIESLPQT